MKLQHEITMLIFVVLLIVGIPGAALILHLQREASISQFEESALTLAATLQESLNHDMMQASRGHIQDAVNRIASSSFINEVVILSNTQRVYASDNNREVGEIRNDELIAKALASGEVVATEELYGRNELCVILPVMNKPECHSCHGSEAETLGAIEISLDKAPLDNQIKNQTIIMLIIGGFTFLGVGGALTLTMRSAVVNPLSKLAASASRIARGDFSARADVGGKDEVGMVASAFNDMASRIEQYASTLQNAKNDLERRVKDRTKQIEQMAWIRGRLLERLISAQEEERRRIARELHDEGGQALSAIMMDLARAIDDLPKEAEETKKKLSHSRSLAAQTLAELRKLIYDLRPEALDQLGLEPALRSYAKSHLDGQNMKVRLNFYGLKGRLPSQVELTLFRVIQEAITNIIRHAKASTVDIQVVAGDSVVTATVEDNGVGFDVETAFEASESWGLRGMRERMAVVGGNLSIEPRDGQGTRIQFEIPLKAIQFS